MVCVGSSQAPTQANPPIAKSSIQDSYDLQGPWIILLMKSFLCAALCCTYCGWFSQLMYGDHVVTITYPFSDSRTKLTVTDCRLDPLKKRNTAPHISLEQKEENWCC